MQKPSPILSEIHTAVPEADRKEQQWMLVLIINKSVLLLMRLNRNDMMIKPGYL